MREGEFRTARKGETPRKPVLLAGIELPSELTHRAQHVFQRRFDGTVARTNSRPLLFENLEACQVSPGA
jgi:hypothetical protein